MNAFGSLAEAYLSSREAASRGGLSLTRQIIEMLTLKTFRDMGPRYYHMARFWRPEISFRDKWRHANEREYIRLVFSLNRAQYQKISQHKVAEKSILSLFGIPTPNFVGFFHDVRGRDRFCAPLCNTEHLHRVLRPYANKRVCFKAVEGFGGLSFYALAVDAEARTLTHPITRQCWPLAEWVEHLLKSREGWLVEEFLQQHPELAELNETSVNTLRLWVLEDQGKFKVHHALLRVGRAGSQVDNIISGGFGCAVDVDTGKLQPGLDVRHPHEPLTRHPDSGLNLVGRQIPFWPEILSTGCDALSVFPNMRFAGMDVAVTPTGPAVIELNVYPARRSVVWWDLPHKDFFEPVIQRVQKR